MALDKAAPVYTGIDKTMKDLSEYENYLREQVAHELELLNRRIKALEAALGMRE